MQTFSTSRGRSASWRHVWHVSSSLRRTAVAEAVDAVCVDNAVVDAHGDNASSSNCIVCFYLTSRCLIMMTVSAKSAPHPYS